jgi:hypothetical protein
VYALVLVALDRYREPVGLLVKVASYVLLGVCIPVTHAAARTTCKGTFLVWSLP